MSSDECDEVELGSELFNLKKQRGSIKGRLTLFEKHVCRLENILLTERQQNELLVRTETIEKLFITFNKIQNQIELLTDETNLIKQCEYRELFENQYFNIISVAKCLTKRSTDNSEGDHSQYVHKGNSVSIKLPEIKIPSFDGAYDHWLEFKNSYVSMIHKRSDLDSIQKFHYLKSSLSGSALQVISALEFTAVNYVHAWELLENRYHNSRLLIQNHVKSLFTAQSINKESPIQIRNLIDVVLRNLRALKSLDEPTDSWDTLVIYIIVSKLDPSTEREWEYHKGTLSSSSQQNKIKLDDLLSFLRNRADMLDMIHNNHSKITHSSKYSNENKKFYNNNSQKQQVHSFVSTRNTGSKSGKSTRICVVCGKYHELYACIQFLNSSVHDRIKLVNDKQLCRNCLRSGHLITECVFGPCKQCQQKHNSLLHIENQNTPAAAPASLAMCAHQSQSADKPVAVVSCASNSPEYTHKSIQLPQILLSTALVEVMDNNNQYHTARALLDSGSQNCFISEGLLKRLNVSVIQSIMHISGVGQSVSQSNERCDINMRSLNNNYNTQLHCFVLPNITSRLPPNHFDCSTLNIPNNICLADPKFNIPSEIDLLIGADVFWDLLNEERVRLPNGPYLQNTKLGWLISGPIYTKHLQHNNNSSHCNIVQLSDINFQLNKFWELEEVERFNYSLNEDERKCEEIFTNTTIRDSTGRFVVRIPLRESADALGDSFYMAKSRFLSLERKLERLPSFKKMYHDFIQEYIDMGHMTRINEYSWPYYFLPHHGVFREHSATTKLRVVFDASAATTSNKSLNDIQLVGPPLQNDIMSILLRFRQYKYVACADIEKMYRQVLVYPDQRNLQLILWRNNPNENLSIYQLNTVTYGTASAPFLSMRCLRQLALDTKNKVIARVLNEDFFVDDLSLGHDDPDTLLNMCHEVSQYLKSACFPLRKWTFNHDINTTMSKELAIGEHVLNKTLGLGWQVDRDELYYTTRLEPTNLLTKRTMMSVIAQIYDPLGLLSPTIIIAKIILQKLWLCKIDWDEPIPDHIIPTWNKFIQSLSQLSNLRVPRFVLSEFRDNCELHIFSDASQDAYGACAYIRTYNTGSPVYVNLLCAKSKVAPVKTVCTIPRLELCGALLGARLYKKIIKSLRLTFTKVYFWTDSTIVIGWTRMSPYNLKTFVQNRVSQINEITGDASWLHVISKDNPADMVSRGLSLTELKDNSLWWHGPLFLQNYELNCVSDIEISENQLPEIKSHTITMLNNQLINYNNLFNFNRYSSYTRLQRAASYVLRFIYNCRKHKQDRQTGPLSVDELEASTIMLTRLVQQQSFSKEYNQLINNNTISSKRLLNLNIFIDKNKLIRVGGRLSNSPHFNLNKKHPILLCSKHRFTYLLFNYEHKRLLHGGPQLLLACVREAWWPLGGRNLARKVVRECVKCTRLKGKTIQPQMGNLPAERLEPGFPFKRCGVDYAGPIMILNRKGRGAKLTKAYISLFICLCTRSIHLELVTSLTTSDYILALKRFISRRGKPAEIISDNAKNFVGVEKEIVTFLDDNKNELVDFATSNQIKFSFIPPYAPHFGGSWEVGIKSCKYHLRRIVGNAHLNYEEFSTVLAQIEAILNSRPLTSMSTDPNDLQPLTPAHFLIGRPLTAPACNDLTTTPTHRLSRYGIIEKIRQDFWNRWTKEYISELQIRTKWKSNQGSLKLDQIVLIKDDNLPPLKWKVGRIVRLYPGTDKISRVADIRTSTGIVRRAYPKICPLFEPLDNSNHTTTDDVSSPSS